MARNGESYVVPSAKFSEANRRGLEPWRTLPTDEYEPWERAELDEVIALVDPEREAGATIASVLRRCQAAIRTAREEVGGKSRGIAPYTARQQVRANLAKTLSPEEVAVIMGHASAATAQSH